MMHVFALNIPQPRGRLAALLWSLAMLAASVPLLASAEELPRFVTQNGRHALFVDGAPYTVLAAQLHNSSAWPAVLPKALDEVVALHANTVEAPVYWEQFEPAPGHFDTTNVDALIAGARKRGLRVALLWFGSWKNGQMHYVPEWIKRDDATYPRMRDANGEPVDVLSPHVAANMQADARAFTALMQHLRKVDGDRHTVILVQVENEPGAIGTVRDHGPAGEAAFAQPVPAAIAQALGKPQGSWQQLFGAEAAEAFNAHATAAYIEQVAAAGRRAYPLPLYVNTWLRYKGKRYPGMDYPSGGATVNVFALWRAATVDRLHRHRYLHQRLQRIHQGHRPVRAAGQSGLGVGDRLRSGDGAIPVPCAGAGRDRVFGVWHGWQPGQRSQPRRDCSARGQLQAAGAAAAPDRPGGLRRPAAGSGRTARRAATHAAFRPLAGQGVVRRAAMGRCASDPAG